MLNIENSLEATTKSNQVQDDYGTPKEMYFKNYEKTTANPIKKTSSVVVELFIKSRSLVLISVGSISPPLNTGKGSSFSFETVVNGV